MSDPIHIHVDNVHGNDAESHSDELHPIRSTDTKRLTYLFARLAKLLRRCAILALPVCLLTACPGPVRDPTPGNVPACGPTLARQQVLLSFAGSEPFPQIRDVTWTISTHCQAQSGQTPFVDNRYITVIQEPRRGFSTGTTTFDELGLGRLMDHTEQTNLVSFTLANAAQANWCITIDVRFAGTNPPSDIHFGPVTARQVAGTSTLLLNFIATVDSSGRVSIAPGFDAMNTCVSR